MSHEVYMRHRTKAVRLDCLLLYEWAVLTRFAPLVGVAPTTVDFQHYAKPQAEHGTRAGFITLASER